MIKLRFPVRCLLLVVMLFFLFTGGVSAAESGTGGSSGDGTETEDFQQLYDSLLEESGAGDLFRLLPEEPKKLLEENGITGIDQESILSLNFWDLIQGGWTGLKASAQAPLIMLTATVGVILLCALLDSLKSSFSVQSHEGIFSVVSVVCISSAIVVPIAQMILKTAALLKSMSEFLLSFIPVYVGIVTASGKPVSGAAYNACLIGTIEVIARLAATVLVPLLAIYLAICLVGAASREIDMQGISKVVRNVVITSLSFLLTIFVGLLSIQGTIAAAADTVTMKTMKFAIGTFVPVVGGAISDAFNTVQSCMGVIKSTVGGFGILAIAAAFLPAIISLLLMQLSLAVAGGVADALGVKQVGGLMKSASGVLSILLGILLVFAMLFIVSVSIMMALSSGGT